MTREAEKIHPSLFIVDAVTIRSSGAMLTKYASLEMIMPGSGDLLPYDT